MALSEDRDSIFHGHDLPRQLASASARTAGASVFAYHVADPERYGVVAFNAQQRPRLPLERRPRRECPHR